MASTNTYEPCRAEGAVCARVHKRPRRLMLMLLVFSRGGWLSANIVIQRLLYHKSRSTRPWAVCDATAGCSTGGKDWTPIYRLGKTNFIQFASFFPSNMYVCGFTGVCSGGLDAMQMSASGRRSCMMGAKGSEVGKGGG